jgi:drug/metabolite transporter (DMT)-like permease
MNKRDKLITNGMLTATSFLWGSAFAFRKIALTYLGVFFFNGLRFGVSFIVIFSAYLIIERIKKQSKNPTLNESGGSHAGGKLSAESSQTGGKLKASETETQLAPGEFEQKPLLWQIKSGILIGFFFGVGSSFQQFGLLLSDAGKGAFISALYIFFIPLINLLILRKKVEPRVWLGVFIAIIGLFFISMGDDFNIILGDVLFLATAFFYAIQIIIISRRVIYANPLFLVSMQLITCSVMSMVLAIIFERGNTLEGIISALFPIIYTGVLSLGVANLLQFIAQKKANPSIAGIIMSLESVFGAGFAAIILRERMNAPQITGCGLIFLAIILSQIERKK